MRVASTAPLLCTLPDPRPGAGAAIKGAPARREARVGIRALHLGATADTRSMRPAAVVQIRATRPVIPAHTVGTRLKTAADPVHRPRSVGMEPRQASGRRPTARMARPWRKPLPHRIRMALRSPLRTAISPLHTLRPRVGQCRRREDLMEGVLLEGKGHFLFIFTYIMLAHHSALLSLLRRAGMTRPTQGVPLCHRMRLADKALPNPACRVSAQLSGASPGTCSPSSSRTAVREGIILPMLCLNAAVTLVSFASLIFAPFARLSPSYAAPPADERTARWPLSYVVLSSFCWCVRCMS